MIAEVLTYLIISVFVYYLYEYKKVHRFFENRGVKYLPGVPIFGNTMMKSLDKKHFVEELREVHAAFPDERYVGFIDGVRPIIMIRDPNLVKTIMSNDFEHFKYRTEMFGDNVDPLVRNSLFMMKDNKWRDMRNTLTPAFTASKMRQMMPHMTDVTNNIINYINEQIHEDIDVKDLAHRYTSDVMVSAGFGLQINSLIDKNNQFYTLGQQITELNPKQKAVVISLLYFPKVAELLNLRIYSKESENFFISVLSRNKEHRDGKHVENHDMIHTLMEAYARGMNKPTEDDGLEKVPEKLKYNGPGRQWTLTELAAQIFNFFIASYEATATTLTMSIHELALNSDAQEKLYQEIKTFNEKNGELTYDNIGELKYMDCVLNETLRKWTTAFVAVRVCIKPYELPPPREGGKPYQLKKGDLVYNGLSNINMDPKYWPEPEKFDPERFSEENKSNIKPFTFMPFGTGPRSCIGSRFTMLNLKVFLYHLVLKYKILKCSKTPEQLRLIPANILIRVVGGSILKFQVRK